MATNVNKLIHDHILAPGYVYDPLTCRDFTTDAGMLYLAQWLRDLGFVVILKFDGQRDDIYYTAIVGGKYIADDVHVAGTVLPLALCYATLNYFKVDYKMDGE